MTSNDFADPEFRKNLSLTAEDLLSMNVVPVFNENDAISSRQNSADVSVLLSSRKSCMHGITGTFALHKVTLTYPCWHARHCATVSQCSAVFKATFDSTGLR